MSALIKNATAFLGFALLLGVGYLLLTNEGGAGLTTTDGVASAQEVETEAFLKKLDELKRIRLNSDLFFDQRFVTLRDMGLSVEPVTVGRANPFVPNE